MKIAIITSGILPVPAVQGGAVENLTDFYLEYNETHKKHHITVYSVYHPAVKSIIRKQQTIHYHYIPTHTLWYRIKKHLYNFFHKEYYYNYHLEFFLHEVIKDIKKRKYDTIIFENRPGFILPVSQVSDAKMILHLHNDLLNNSTPYAKKILNRCQYVLTVSNYIKERVATIQPCEKIQTVYNGINLSAFQKRNLRPEITRDKLNLNPNDFVLVYSGRIIPEKGVKELIQAMLLLKDFPQIKLIIIGGSFFGNDVQKNPYIQSLKKLAEPIQQQIRFTGFRPYNEIPSYLAISDVCIVPSLWNDPLPTSVLEGMASKLPIIATLSGGIPEEIIPECACIIDKNNLIKELAYYIKKLYQSPDLCKKMRQASYTRSRYFNKERFGKDLFSHIENL